MNKKDSISFFTSIIALLLLFAVCATYYRVFIAGSYEIVDSEEVESGLY